MVALLARLRRLHPKAPQIALAFAIWAACASAMLYVHRRYHELYAAHLPRVQAELASIPPAPFTAIDCTSGAKGGVGAWVSCRYRSSEDYPTVRDHYTRRLSALGWQLIEDREIRRSGQREPDHLLRYRKSTWVADLSYPGASAQTWTYDFAITWQRPE